MSLTLSSGVVRGAPGVPARLNFSLALWWTGETPVAPFSTLGWTAPVSTHFLQALAGSGVGVSSLRFCLTHLWRCERSLRKALASLYKRLRSELLKIAFLKMRYAALGRK